MGKLEYMHYRADVHYDFTQDSINAQWKKTLFLKRLSWNVASGQYIIQKSHPSTISAKFGLIWFSGIIGKMFT